VSGDIGWLEPIAQASHWLNQGSAGHIPPIICRLHITGGMDMPSVSSGAWEGLRKLRAAPQPHPLAFLNLLRPKQVPRTINALTPTMAYLRASLIAVGITTLAAAAAADSFVDRWALERANSTETTTAGITVLAVPKLFSYCGADIVGGDIFTKRYPSPDDCVTNCLPSTGCNAGTWTRVDGGTCYFKRLTKSQALDIRLVPNAGAISFLRKDDASSSTQCSTSICPETT
jgi:hypothetical protein